MDILNDAFFEDLLRLCSCGVVAYAAASPSCSEFSMAKFRPGGPRPLRSPQFLEGFPELSVVHGAGGHGHLEQPASAMSWETPEVQSWLRQGSCSLVHLAACGFGKNWHKSWLFASSFPPLSSMACVCSHGQGAHESVTGIGPDGEFRSRKTAMYPPKLASEFASIIDPLLF